MASKKIKMQPAGSRLTSPVEFFRRDSEMEYKKLSVPIIFLILTSVLLLIFIYYQCLLWLPFVPLHSFVFILVVNILLGLPSNWLHETAHESIAKRKGYSPEKKICAIFPHVKILEPVLLQDYRDIILAPFYFSLSFAVIMIVIVLGLGPFLSPPVIIFVTMRATIQFYGCVTDLFWAWKIRSLPDYWWVADCGKHSYICPTKEKAAELLSATIN